MEIRDILEGLKVLDGPREMSVMAATFCGDDRIRTFTVKVKKEQRILNAKEINLVIFKRERRGALPVYILGGRGWWDVPNGQEQLAFLMEYDPYERKGRVHIYIVPWGQSVELDWDVKLKS